MCQARAQSLSSAQDKPVPPLQAQACCASTERSLGPRNKGLLGKPLHTGLGPGALPGRTTYLDLAEVQLCVQRVQLLRALHLVGPLVALLHQLQGVRAQSRLRCGTCPVPRVPAPTRLARPRCLPCDCSSPCLATGSAIQCQLRVPGPHFPHWHREKLAMDNLETLPAPRAVSLPSGRVGGQVPAHLTDGLQCAAGGLVPLGVALGLDAERLQRRYQM